MLYRAFLWTIITSFTSRGDCRRDVCGMTSGKLVSGIDVLMKFDEELSCCSVRVVLVPCLSEGDCCAGPLRVLVLWGLFLSLVIGEWWGFLLRFNPWEKDAVPMEGYLSEWSSVPGVKEWRCLMMNAWSWWVVLMTWEYWRCTHDGCSSRMTRDGASETALRWLEKLSYLLHVDDYSC